MDELDEDPLLPEADLEGEGEGEAEEVEAGLLRLILVDVQSVAEGAEPLRTLWQGDRGEAASRLVNLLSWAMGQQPVEFLLVMDRKIKMTGLSRGAERMRVHPTAGEQSVSETLLSLLGQMVDEGRRATVVTSDLDVVRRASEHRQQAVLSDLFAISLLGGISTEEQDAFPPPPGLSPEEKAEWDAFVERWEREKGL